MFERLSDAVRSAIVAATAAARDLGHPRVGGEHLLLGLLEIPDGVAARVLARLGVSAERAGASVHALAPAPSGEPPSGEIPFTPHARHTLERALRWALTMGHDEVEPEHLLLALAAEPDEAVGRVFGDLGVDGERIRDELLSALPRAPSPLPLAPAYLQRRRARRAAPSGRLPRAAPVLAWARATTLWRAQGFELRVPLALGDGAIATFAADAAWSQEPLAGLSREIWRGWLALALPAPGTAGAVDAPALRAALDAAAKRAADVGGRERGRIEDFLRRLADGA